ncbi:MAG: hypothetical protein NC548_33900 [Lachnospiraceae bacterium]|nr:hypothetical protein [Lachnospiraceae bacterium]
MSQPENSRIDAENQSINVEEAKEYLQDAASLLIMLENDLSAQCMDGIYIRTVKITHEILKKALRLLSS